MEKRYQVFISSTFSDLQDERRQVMETIMQMDCIPAGMEMFPASDDEQLEFIQKVIDDCDYYILIIGGRYGSEDYQGISYTEREYDYAFNKGIPILVFMHGEPSNIPFGKTESNPHKREKLEGFKKKVSSNRLIKFWTNKGELPGLVALSLTKAIKMYPQVGWIRGNQSNNQDLLEQINNLRIEKDRLQSKVSDLEIMKGDLDVAADNLSKEDDMVELKGTYLNENDTKCIWKVEVSWNEIFSLIGPFLFEAKNYTNAKSCFEDVLKKYINHTSGYKFRIDGNTFQTIKIQLYALKLIKIFNCSLNENEFIETIMLSDLGKKHLIKIKSIKKPDSEE